MSLVGTETHASRVRISLTTVHFLSMSSALQGGTIGHRYLPEWEHLTVF